MDQKEFIKAERIFNEKRMLIETIFQIQVRKKEEFFHPCFYKKTYFSDKLFNRIKTMCLNELRIKLVEAQNEFDRL